MRSIVRPAAHSLIAFAVTVFSVNASALSAPIGLKNGRSGLAVQTLGAACFTFDLAADTLPCNPAYMAKERDRNFKAQIFLGNNVSYLRDATDIAQGKADAATVNRLFNDKKSSEFEASLEAAYLAETFGLAYEPYRISYYSLFQNPALPEITLFASLEDSLRLQLASYSQENIYWGLQLRYLHRQVIFSRFFLTDVLSESRNQYLDPKEQRFIFLEPGLLFSDEKSAWRPEVSLNILNLGFRSGPESAADPVPEYHLGGAISHEIGYGRWGFALNAGWNREIEKASEILTLGSFFEMGILQVYGSLSQFSNGAGFSIHFDSFNLGLAYSAKAEKFSSSQQNYTRRIYFLIGAEL